MNSVKQDNIDSLIEHLCINSHTIESGNSINFIKPLLDIQDQGNFTVDNLKKGIYIIHFADTLSLTLISKSNFKFTNFDHQLSNSISLEGNDINAILELIKILKIKSI